MRRAVEKQLFDDEKKHVSSQIIRGGGCKHD
jgi:hypothetical protein